MALCGHTLTLHDCVTQLLTRNIQHRSQLASDQARSSVGLYSHSCYRCGGLCTVWKVDRVHLTGRCGQPYPHDFVIGSRWKDDRPEAVPEIRNAVTTVGLRRELPPANLSSRYSKTVGHEYMAFSCPHCHALFGDFPLSQELLTKDPYNHVPVEGHAEVPYPHWCLNVGRGFCN